MTKGELIRRLQENKLPDDTEVLISTKKYHDGDVAWDEIDYVDGTENGVPILIGLGETVMEQQIQAEMKVLTLNRRNIQYEFRLLESARVVEIAKAGVLSYIAVGRSGLFYCNCPGAKFHKKCWHTSTIRRLMSQPSIEEPWAEWAEEAGEKQYSKKGGGL